MSTPVEFVSSEILDEVLGIRYEIFNGTQTNWAVRDFSQNRPKSSPKLKARVAEAHQQALAKYQ